MNFIKKEQTKKVVFFFFFFNLGKMVVSDTPCTWQKYRRTYQKLACNSKSYS